MKRIALVASVLAIAACSEKKETATPAVAAPVAAPVAAATDSTKKDSTAMAAPAAAPVAAPAAAPAKGGDMKKEGAKKP